MGGGVVTLLRRRLGGRAGEERVRGRRRRAHPGACCGLRRAGPGAPRVSAAPRAAAEGHRRQRVLGRHGHVSVAERPSACGAQRRSEDPATPDVAQRGEPLRVTGPLLQATQPPARRVSPNLAVRKVQQRVSAQQKVQETHARRQTWVRHPARPGPSVPISEDRLKIILTKAS